VQKRYAHPPRDPPCRLFRGCPWNEVPRCWKFHRRPLLDVTLCPIFFGYRPYVSVSEIAAAFAACEPPVSLKLDLRPDFGDAQTRSASDAARSAVIPSREARRPLCNLVPGLQGTPSRLQPDCSGCRPIWRLMGSMSALSVFGAMELASAEWGLAHALVDVPS